MRRTAVVHAVLFAVLAAAIVVPSLMLAIPEAGLVHAEEHLLPLKSTKPIIGYEITTNQNDRFGSSVTSIGDLDGDGVPDAAVGAPGDSGGTTPGIVYVLFMNRDGTVKSTVTINADTAGPPGAMPNDRFGTTVDRIGDLDGDGIPDIAVGKRGQSESGTVYVLFMNRDGTVKRMELIDETTPDGPGSLAAGDNFGSSVAGIGDLDGDGIPDIAAGAPGQATGMANGSLYVMFMNRDGTVKRTMSINHEAQNRSTGSNTVSNFASSIAGIGDLDGDGMPDAAIGAPGQSADKVSNDQVFVALLNRDGTVKRMAAINHEAQNGPSLSPGDRFGTSVSSLGDLDGDGVYEIAATAPGQVVNGTVTGSAYVMFMNQDGTVKRTLEVNGAAPNGPSTVSGDNFGQSVSGMGDLDRDGHPEIAIGAPSSTHVHVMFTSELQDRTAVRGTVFSDTNGNSIQDAGEPGISGYRMFAIRSGVEPEPAVTDRNGRYVLAGIAPAPETTLIQAGFFPRGHTVAYDTAWYTRITPAAGTTSMFDLGFYPVPAHEMVTLDFTAYLDSNRNGQRDAGEPGVAGFPATVYTYTIGPEAVRTGPNGMLVKTDIVPADWAILLDFDGTGYGPTAYKYTSPSGQTRSSLPAIVDPDPGSRHVMEVGLVPAP